MQFGFAYMIFVAALIVLGLGISVLIIHVEKRKALRKMSPAEEQQYELADADLSQNPYVRDLITHGGVGRLDHEPGRG